MCTIRIRILGHEKAMRLTIDWQNTNLFEYYCDDARSFLPENNFKFF